MVSRKQSKPLERSHAVWLQLSQTSGIGAASLAKLTWAASPKFVCFFNDHSLWSCFFYYSKSLKLCLPLGPRKRVQPSWPLHFVVSKIKCNIYFVTWLKSILTIRVFWLFYAYYEISTFYLMNIINKCCGDLWIDWNRL